jgi:hypothetical protein
MTEAFTTESSKKYQFITNKIHELKIQGSLHMPLETVESKEN